MIRLAIAAAAVSLASSLASAQLVGLEWRNPLEGQSNQDIHPRFFEMLNLDSPSNAFADPFEVTDAHHAYGLTRAGNAFYYIARQSPTGPVRLFRYDDATETFTTIGDTGLAGSGDARMTRGGLAYHAASDTFYALSTTFDNQVSLHTLDSVTGAASLVGNIAVGSGSDIAFDGAGNLYLVESRGNATNGLLHTIDIANANVLTTITLSDAFGPTEAGLAINTRTGEAFLGEVGSGEDLFEINLATGALPVRGDFTDLLENGGNMAGPAGLAFIPTPGAGALALMSCAFAARRRR